MTPEFERLCRLEWACRPTLETFQVREPVLGASPYSKRLALSRTLTLLPERVSTSPPRTHPRLRGVAVVDINAGDALGVVVMRA